MTSPISAPGISFASLGLRRIDGVRASPQGRHHVEHVMGTAVSIDIRGPEIPQEAIDEVVEWLHHVDATFSTYRLDSPISAIGRGEVLYDELSDEIREVLTLCEAVSRDSDGAFDVFQVPAPNSTNFDPSGVVKGWSIERSAQIIERHGCSNFCVNAGGDIVIRGLIAQTEPWRVGIRHPHQADALALVISAQGRLAIATSANYERGGHIIDPRRQRPAQELSSATVVGPDLALADAYATGVFVIGLDGLDWIQNKPGYDAYIITNEEETKWTAGFSKYRSEPTGPQPSLVMS